MKLCSFVVMTMLMSILVSASAHPQDSKVVITGRTSPWSMALTTSWVGGNFYDLQAVVERTPAGSLRDILMLLRNQSRGIEAYLMHYDEFIALADQNPAPQRDESRMAAFSVSNIRIFKAEFAPHLVSMYKDQGFTERVARNFADLEQEKWGKDASVSVVSHSAIDVANLTAYESVIKIATAMGNVYDVIIDIPRGDWVHQFDLRVAEPRFSSRRAELRQMLQTLRYP